MTSEEQAERWVAGLAAQSMQTQTVSLALLLNQVKRDQRVMCANAAVEAYQFGEDHVNAKGSKRYRNACLNATGEECNPLQLEDIHGSV